MSLEILTSDLKSEDNTHNLKISAPYSLIISCGLIPFPADFDIFLPSSSITQPCVNMFLYGEIPFVATEVNIDDWNHPLYWSCPSRYKSAGTLIPLSASTPWCEEPESNHTSIISVSFLNS